MTLDINTEREEKSIESIAEKKKTKTKQGRKQSEEIGGKRSQSAKQIAKKITEEKDETLIPREGRSSVTPDSSCESCNMIEKILCAIHKLIDENFSQPIDDKAWIKKMQLPALSETTVEGQRKAIKKLLTCWANTIESWRDHLWVAGNQFKHFDSSINNLQEGEEVWLHDFAMTIALHQAMKATQSKFFKKEYANNLGFVVFRRIDGKIQRHYHDFFSTDPVRQSSQ